MIKRIDRRSKLALTILASLVFLAVGVMQFAHGIVEVFDSPDTGWILKTGEYILANGRIPTHDLYSWTCPDRHWVVYQWLFEATAALFLKFGKLWLAGLAAYMVSGFLLFFVLPRSWLTRGIPLWLTLGMLCLCFNDVWFFLRPQLASFLLIPLFLGILENYRVGMISAKVMWALPLLMVLWVNLHSFWFIGLIAILSYAIASPRGERRLWLLLLVSALAVFINPYGVGIVTYNFSFVTDASRGIAELQSPLIIQDLQCWQFLTYMLICWLILLRNIRRVPREGLIFAAISSAAGLYAARFMPVAILGTWALLGVALERRKSNEKLLALFSRSHICCLTFLALSLVLPFLLWSRGIQSQEAATRLFAQGEYEGIYFLATHKVSSEKLYNDEGLGSRLLFFDLAKVFIDNRFDMYGKQFCDRWFAAHYASDGWKEYLAGYGVSAVAIGDKAPLYNPLFFDADWLLAYDDNHMSYWLRDSVPHRQMLQQWNLNVTNIGAAGLTSQQATATKQRMAGRSAFMYKKGLAAQKAKDHVSAIKYFNLLAFMIPGDPAAHHLLIHELAVSGKVEELATELKTARPFFWRFDAEESWKKSGHKYSFEENKRIDDWVRSATDQLLKKYRTN